MTFIDGVLLTLGFVAAVASAWVLYDSWVEYTDAKRVLEWFEETNLGDG